MKSRVCVEQVDPTIMAAATMLLVISMLLFTALVILSRVSVRSDCPACVMEWVIVSTMDSGHLEVGDGEEEGVEEAGLV